MALLEDVPGLLRDLRLRARLTQAEAGTHIGRSDKTISAYENGGVSPQIDDFLALLELYGVRDLGALARPRRIEGEVEPSGHMSSVVGMPRKHWVALLVRHGVTEESLAGLGYAAEVFGVAGDEADLVESAQRAAVVLADDLIAQANENPELLGRHKIPIFSTPRELRSTGDTFQRELAEESASEVAEPIAPKPQRPREIGKKSD